jgi:SpoVK/Ycf46/Vps4 family AAA+-type ATPase
VLDEHFEAATRVYINNLVLRTPLRRFEARHLEVLEDVGPLVAAALKGGAPCAACARSPEERPKGPHLRTHLRSWATRSRRRTTVPSPADPVARNLRLLGAQLALKETDLSVLAFLLALRGSDDLQRMTGSFGDQALPAACDIVAAAAGLQPSLVLATLRPQGRLVSTGLVEVESDPNEVRYKFKPHPQVIDAMVDPSLDRRGLLQYFVKPAPGSALAARDFAHVGTDLENLLELLRGAIREGVPGINVLIHGQSGTGKTELARLVADLLGLPLFAVPPSEAISERGDGMARLRSLLAAGRIVGAGGGLLLFDELEDVFRWEFRFFAPPRAVGLMSKLGFNLLLERNPAPTLWLSNEVRGIDPAFLRRFTFALELRDGGATRRVETLRRHASGDLSESDVEALGARFHSAPAEIASAVRAARLVSPEGRVTRTAVESFLGPVEKLIRGKDPRRTVAFDPGAFLLDAVHCREGLHELVERLSQWRPTGKAGISLCLYGRPGTGKSEFVHYLAWRMERRVVARRVSDLVSKWVGETERNIAKAFAEAEADDAFLLFDEADSFLRDRSAAEHSWEVTEVNEFLQQLEGFPGVVACTTNLWRNLDEAALRRFSFKLEFLFPTAEQATMLFRGAFPEVFAEAGEAAVLAAMRMLPSLAPGDFAAVARRIQALGERPGFEELVRRLAAEVAVKRGPGRAVGFG